MLLNSMALRQARTAAFVGFCPCWSLPKPHSMKRTCCMPSRMVLQNKDRGCPWRGRMLDEERPRAGAQNHLNLPPLLGCCSAATRAIAVPAKPSMAFGAIRPAKLIPNTAKNEAVRQHWTRTMLRAGGRPRGNVVGETVRKMHPFLRLRMHNGWRLCSCGLVAVWGLRRSSSNCVQCSVLSSRVAS